MQALTRRVESAPRRPWPSQPVSVALVITELEVGGAERALVELATRLDRRRFSPRIIALGPEAALVKPLRARGVPVTCLGVDSRRPIRAVARLAGVLRESKPALVQSFLFHANIASRLAAPLAGRPWVVGGIRVAERRKTWHLWLERATAGLATGSVCVSEGVAEFMMTRGRWPKARLTVIRNGIDVGAWGGIEPLERSEWPGALEGRLVLFAGRLDVQKDVPTLLRAARVVAERVTGWRLLVAGDGPEGPALREMTVGDPVLDGVVSWLGFRGDLPRLMATADLLVLPSRWEGMPNVVLEAMAAGKAVVATDVEGTRELVEPGRTGWLVPASDPTALAAALIEAGTDPARLRALGEAARARVASEFSLDSVVLQYQRLWARILGFEEPGFSPG